MSRKSPQVSLLAGKKRYMKEKCSQSNAMAVRPPPAWDVRVPACPGMVFFFPRKPPVWSFQRDFPLL